MYYVNSVKFDYFMSPQMK